MLLLWNVDAPYGGEHSIRQDGPIFRGGEIDDCGLGGGGVML